MKDVVPAMLFIGELVRVTTTIERLVVQEEQIFEDGEVFEQEPQTASLILLGIILDSDETYLTLGAVGEDGLPHPKAALKHADIKLIELYEEDDGLVEKASQIDDSLIN